ncbi:MAG: hypothetical protein L0Z50_30210 [Verrucomicrobiales bacterium]|nr:hypothetical protein [Verrucomicrobiales bacterium]
MRTYDLTFKFYEAGTGGPALGISSASKVTVTDGIASTPIPVDASWFIGQTQTRYLGVTINNGQELSPRVLVAAVPYALRANHAETAGNLLGDLFVHRLFWGSPAHGGFGAVLDIDQGGCIELGDSQTPGGLPFIDFHYGTGSAQDYNVRLQNDSNGALSFYGASLNVNSALRCQVLQITGGADLAEHLSVADANLGDEFRVEPGMVVSIDPAGNRKFKLADEPYDRKRVGIISGGNGVKPGLVLRDEGNPQTDGDQPIALTGQVWCHADASFGAIIPGDLLTTSSTPGHAMKVSEETKARFAVLGQALTGLKEGRGWVQVLVGKQ